MAGFEQSYESLYEAAYRVAYRLLVDREAAADTAQEAVVRAYIHWSKIAEYSVPWVSRTAGNLALDELRRRPASTAPAPNHAPDPADRAVAHDLIEAMRKLPRRQREVVVLRYVADLSEQVTAQQLGCSVGTVKSHAHRALRALGVSMKEIDDEPAVD